MRTTCGRRPRPRTSAMPWRSAVTAATPLSLAAVTCGNRSRIVRDAVRQRWDEHAYRMVRQMLTGNEDQLALGQKPKRSAPRSPTTRSAGLGTCIAVFSCLMRGRAVGGDSRGGAARRRFGRGQARRHHPVVNGSPRPAPGRRRRRQADKHLVVLRHRVSVAADIYFSGFSVPAVLLIRPVGDHDDAASAARSR